MEVKCYHREFFSGAGQGAGKHPKVASSRIPYHTAESHKQQQREEESAACFNLPQSLLQGTRKSAASLKGQRAYFNPHTWLSLPRCLQREHS